MRTTESILRQLRRRIWRSRLECRLGILALRIWGSRMQGRRRWMLGKQCQLVRSAWSRKGIYQAQRPRITNSITSSSYPKYSLSCQTQIKERGHDKYQTKAKSDVPFDPKFNVCDKDNTCMGTRNVAYRTASTARFPPINEPAFERQCIDPALKPSGEP